MKITDIRKLADKEIVKMLAEKREEVRQFRFDIAGSKAKNVKTGSNTKKDVARLLTELASRKAN
ncbi:MAG: 50S ribosomal protein L29 [Candidatus Lloydbacteria bacterium RIFOXYC12_FULL_46_25]|uniref:Large ribosomal subunit protein uL29 n=1 Tax=Candidatus Lloydbacteria bacterium RIFOXYC12_FULL_46_25 TaxID=1798670 RepID=A0A1G2DS53_9BACT|nr:MAG: 50S ribosomal protein L29 [Candidatus Lloydbacteria bacterium RIFOXYC12_FULL_46_25]